LYEFQNRYSYLKTKPKNWNPHGFLILFNVVTQGRPAAQVDHIPSANSFIHKRERRINNNKNNNNNNNNNNNDNSIHKGHLDLVILAE
jgi:hypothetical protein